MIKFIQVLHIIHVSSSFALYVLISLSLNIISGALQLPVIFQIRFCLCLTKNVLWSIAQYPPLHGLLTTSQKEQNPLWTFNYCVS